MTTGPFHSHAWKTLDLTERNYKHQNIGPMDPSLFNKEDMIVIINQPLRMKYYHQRLDQQKPTARLYLRREAVHPQNNVLREHT